MPELALVGDLTVDRVNGGEPRIGGAVYYGARALAVCVPRPETLVVCRCAEDDRDVLIPHVEALGFPVRWAPSSRTTRFAIDYSGDSRAITVESIADPWTPADVAGWLEGEVAGSSWLLLGALLEGDMPAPTTSALGARGHRLAADAHCLVRGRAVGPLRERSPEDPAVLDSIDLLKLNDDEARTLCGEATPAAVRALGVSEVLLTLGGQGAHVVTDREHAFIDPPVLRASDPTGAGDAFTAGYLAARLAGLPPAEAGVRAATVVERAITG